MKITDFNIIRSRKPIILPEAWRPAWSMPDVPPRKTTSFSFFKIHTDEGITGIAPGYMSPSSVDLPNPE